MSISRNGHVAESDLRVKGPKNDRSWEANFCPVHSPLNNFPGGPIIEPHGRGVPEAILNDRSPRPGLPECRRSPHEGRPGRGERPLSVAEGTPSREVLFLLYPPIPQYLLIKTFSTCKCVRLDNNLPSFLQFCSSQIHREHRPF